MALCGCSHPILARDGTLVFQEKGAHGASVVTANGIEFHDVVDVPVRVVVRDPYEPWRAPLGFLIPKDGRFTKTSVPTLVATTGLAVSLRPSDTRVPSWGGEMLVRVDVLAPAAAGSARWGGDVAFVLDGRSDDLRALADAAMQQLGGRDRVEVVDASTGRIVVPAMPASHRSLVLAAIERALALPAAAHPHRTKAVATALAGLTKGTERRVLVLSADPNGNDEGPAHEWVAGLGDEFVPLAVVTPADGDLKARVERVQDFVPRRGRRRSATSCSRSTGRPRRRTCSRRRAGTRGGTSREASSPLGTCAPATSGPRSCA